MIYYLLNIFLTWRTEVYFSISDKLTQITRPPGPPLVTCFSLPQLFKYTVNGVATVSMSHFY